MDTDGTAAQLTAIQDDIICLGTYLCRITLQKVKVLIHRCGKRVMHGNIPVFLFAVFKLREFYHPQQLVILRVNDTQTLCQLAAQCAQRHNCGLPVGIRYHKQDIAILCASLFLDCCNLILAQELGKGRSHLAVRSQLHPCQTLGTIGLDKILQLVNFLARELVCRTVDVNQTDGTAIGNRTVEYLKGAILCDIRNIHNFIAKAQIRLIRAILVHGILPLHARQRQLNVHIQHFLKHALEKAFVDSNHIILIDKGHFQVNLGKFRLTVCTQVLVTEAAGDLHIAVHTGQHQQLLVLLRGLGQGIELTRMHTGRNQIVTCAFRRGLLQHRGFDFQKALFIKIVACYLGDTVAQSQIALHGWTAQIQITVLQAQLVIDFLGIGNLKGRSLRLGQHADVGNGNFNFAGGHLFVDGTLVTADNLALDCQHIFGAYTESDIKQVCIDRLVKGTLYGTGTVTQQQEQDTAVVTGAFTPAVDNDFLLSIRCTQFAAPCGTLHALNGCIHK